MSSPSLVLLSNDDGPPGPEAPYLLPFIKCWQELNSQLFVCLPAENQSWVSKRMHRFGDISISRVPCCSYASSPCVSASSTSEPSSPIVVCKCVSDASSPDQSCQSWTLVSSTPSTAVNIALSHLCPEADLVIVGPNYGRNTGRSCILSSGTVGGAMEAAICGKRGVALSFAFYQGHKMSPEEEAAAVRGACEKARAVILDLWANWEAGVEVYNVNVPLGASADTPVVRTSISSHCYGSLFSPSDDTLSTFKFGPFKLSDPHVEENSDIWAVERKMVSVTALVANLHHVPPARS
eukprot:GILI01004761.1.p1 GENE.GILI01004761.1~~GILI01004761.1.p1  ORF type:complete len:294 (-),score=64.39 GILI01004761.1:327-1208(-)